MIEAVSPDVPVDCISIIDADGIFDLKSVPATMVVVGAGVVGMEYACMFTTLGALVTVVESRKRRFRRRIPPSCLATRASLPSRLRVAKVRTGRFAAARLLLILLPLALVSCGRDRGPSDGWPGVHAPLRADPAPFGGWTRESRYLEMRDGVRLAIDVYLPEGLAPGVRLPAILHQTSYHRSHAFRWPFNLVIDRPGPLVELFARQIG